MTREKATRIVNEFFNDMNPTLWNGEGINLKALKNAPGNVK